MVKLLNGDCLELFKDIPDESIDLVVTDCPYHIVGGGCSNGAYGNPSGIFNKEPRKDKFGNKYYSDTKQAGNSIVVDVLMAIFKELFSGS